MANEPADKGRFASSACQHPGEDRCDWHYDGGDYSVGVSGCWICLTCEAMDAERDPPSDPDADAYERNL